MEEWPAFLSGMHTQISSLAAASLGEVPAQYAELLSKTTVSLWADRGIIEIAGPDTDKLLQGQLTCDMKQMQQNDALPGALCDPKGRMISNFLTTRTSPNSVLLVMPAEVVANTLETLNKFAVFYKTSITDVSSQHRVFGLNLQSAEEFALMSLPLSRQLKIIIATTNTAPDIWKDLSASYTATGVLFWEYLLIREGLGEVRAQTIGEFIPQMLNLQHTGALNFRKGCYTGQEIVARMQYLGKLKRRMYRLKVSCYKLPTPGTLIGMDDKAGVGTVVMAGWSNPQEVEILAVLTAEAALSQQLTFDGMSGNVQLLPLPYDDKFIESRT